jgi:hypothetical protein
MGPARTGGKQGAFQFDRRFPGVGRIKKTSGTTKLKEFQRRDALLTKLYEQSALHVLRAFKDGDITIEQIIEADRGNNPAMSMDRIATTQSLTAAITKALPKMGKSPATRDRYQRSLEKLLNTVPTLQHARVGDLAGVDWHTLEQRWQGGAADWNHMRRALSTFLSKHLGDKYHPLRRAIVSSIAQRKEVARTPDQSPELFLSIIEHAPVPLREVFLTIALTGMRIGEYVFADKHALHPNLHAVNADGKSGSGLVYLTPEAYAVVARNIPCPFGPAPYVGQPTSKIKRYGIIERAWRKAKRKAGITRKLTLHDIRHLYGQTASDEGVPSADTQAGLRHATASMTRRYEMPQQSRRASTAVAERLGIQATTPKKVTRKRA